MLKFKSIEGFIAFINHEGKIAIEQDSYEFGKPVQVYLTTEQFETLGHWVYKNKAEIELTWNEGLENE